MPALIATDEYSARLRARAIKIPERRLLIAKLSGSEQEQDLKEPPNCDGFGRIRHFHRNRHTDNWPTNPLPIDPAIRALGLPPSESLNAQVFQNAACNWRCWYCFVPFNMLDAKPESGAWLTPDELVSLYLAEPSDKRARMIDLTGGQPDLVPEWVPWTMESLRERGLEGRVFLWSDDNLSTDYYWRFLDNRQQELVSSFKGYGRVGCFKGFDDESFSFNTQAHPELFQRQFELFERMLKSGVDLYAYTTFTATNVAGIGDKVARFVDRLQAIDENLPLRTVPLQVHRLKVLDARLDAHQRYHELGKIPFEAQQRAIEAWCYELEKRFSSDMRERRITEVPMGLRKSE
ncbi:hypothetical protein F0U61_01165 [Archangium violaceum]|uniref:hypothetical protein n=1 Tax=Archangium violaceum TaxID=83451 RepID=UPI002B31586B|nr:hypothetical protein F0U61_01165 [Archangium violaceum]